MALIDCYECKREISSAAAGCPHCGAPKKEAPPSAEGAGIRKASKGQWLVGQRVFYSQAAAEEFTRSSGAEGGLHSIPAKPPQVNWKGMLIALGAVAGALSMCVGSGEGSGRATGQQVQLLGELDALAMCQYALKRASRDPEKAEVPYVPDHGQGDDFYFAWGGATKMARMRNGLGLDVAVSASCIVSKSRKRITSLTLDGRSLVGASAQSAQGAVFDVRVGMSRSEVTMLLGEPDHTDYPGNGAEIMTWGGGAMVSMQDGRVIRALN